MLPIGFTDGNWKMNWDVAGDISEIIGAAAVVVSLLYLAVQVRQSTELARSQYHTNSVTLTNPFQNWKSANAENARIFREGMFDFRALSVDERIILDGVLMAFVMSFKDVLEARDRGLMDDATYVAWAGYVGTTLGMLGGLTWWEYGRSNFIPKLQAAIDASIDEYPPYDELMSVIFENGP